MIASCSTNFARDTREEPQVAVDDKVVVGQTRAADDPEAVLIGYLLGVEALRAGKQVVMWLTKDGVYLATDGYSDGLSVPDAPAIKDLHAEYVDKGGRFLVCPVCVKTHKLENATWVTGAEVKGAPSLYEFTAGGALTFNY
jgi:predicted peroxiredoxin